MTLKKLESLVAPHLPTGNQANDPASSVVFRLAEGANDNGIYDLTALRSSLEAVIGCLEAVRDVLIPPQVAWCTRCSWVGTTHEATWVAQYEEWSCPECGSADDIVVLSSAAAAETVTENRDRMKAALDRIAAWNVGIEAEANHEHA
jgi:hypothetical protein